MTYALGLHCPNCGKDYELTVMVRGCPACRTDHYVSNLEVTYDYDSIAAKYTHKMLAVRPPSLWRYAELLPLHDLAHIVSLGEGATPLVPIPKIGNQIGIPQLHLKNESMNPTWSFKDRLCSVAISKAKEFGSQGIVASSSGNHGASAAAYAAHAGLPCVVVTLESSPREVTAQMQVYGACVVATTQSMERWEIMSYLVEQGWYGVTNFMAPAVGSIPYGVEGHKTISFEITEQLDGCVPDFVVMPAAYADGLAGVWKGFMELNRLGWIQQQPRMVAAEAHGPLANALKRGLDYVEAVPIQDETIAHSIGGDISTTQGLRTLRASNGEAVPVSNKEIVAMQHRLAATEGIYLEPTSATALVAVEQLAARDVIKPEHVVVVVATSSGLKDPAAVMNQLPDIPVLQPDPKILQRTLHDVYNVDIA